MSRNSAGSPTAGGWRLDGANNTDHQRSRDIRTGFDFVHVAVDDHSRVAYAEVLADERAETCAAFLYRAVRWFRDQHDVTVRRVLTDNALSYRKGTDWRWVCHALQLKRRFIKPGCPWTNGKAERFNRTLLTDWAYAQPWFSTAERNAAFDVFLPHLLQHSTRTHRSRRSPTDHPPRRMSPVNNVPRQDT
jgi:transposase InsO family protein